MLLLNMLPILAAIYPEIFQMSMIHVFKNPSLFLTLLLDCQTRRYYLNCWTFSSSTMAITYGLSIAHTSPGSSNLEKLLPPSSVQCLLFLLGFALQICSSITSSLMSMEKTRKGGNILYLSKNDQKNSLCHCSAFRRAMLSPDCSYSRAQTLETTMKQVRD